MMNKNNKKKLKRYTDGQLLDLIEKDKVIESEKKQDKKSQPQQKQQQQKQQPEIEERKQVIEDHVVSDPPKKSTNQRSKQKQRISQEKDKVSFESPSLSKDLKNSSNHPTSSDKKKRNIEETLSTSPVPKKSKKSAFVISDVSNQKDEKVLKKEIKQTNPEKIEEVEEIEEEMEEEKRNLDGNKEIEDENDKINVDESVSEMDQDVDKKLSNEEEDTNSFKNVESKEKKPPKNKNEKNVDFNCVSHFAPNDANSLYDADTSTICFALKAGESIVFQGMSAVLIVKGTARIMGQKLKASNDHHLVYSPLNVSIPRIESVPQEEKTEEIIEIEDRIKPKLVNINFNNFDTVILFKYIFPDFLGLKMSPGYQYLFPVPTRQKYSLPNFEPIFSPVQGVTDIKIPESWSDTIERISNLDDEIILLCGPKGVGKSTFSRMLTNKLVNLNGKVAFMETDLGQTDLTPPGMLSITTVNEMFFGPSFTHLRNPEWCQFIGKLSPKDCPQYYFSCIKQGFEYYKENIKPKGVKLVINTHGWVKGVGFEMLKSIFYLFRPNQVIEIQSSSYSKNLPDSWNTSPDVLGFVTNEQFNYQLTKIKSVPSTILNPFGPGDQRNISLITYFDFHLTNPDCTSFVPLSVQVPYKISWSAVGVSFVNPIPSIEDSLHVLNGSIVGLVIDPQDSYLKKPDYITSKDGKRLACPRVVDFPINSKGTICVGLGIVRGIDVNNRVFHLITPVPPKVLNEVNTLVKGSIDLPVQMMIQGGYFEGPYLSFLSTEGQGAIERRARHNILRRKNVGNN